ncbi:MAG TPA: RagB/SusD family nutrient uptake outer membrane protein [Gemmatimonadales bacterium]|jgi:SusD family.
MRHSAALAFLLVGSLAACDSVLDQSPPDRLPTEDAITDARGARAALAGAYDGLRGADEFYYAAEFITLGDLSADNVVSVGISGPFDFADANQLRANNSSVAGVWEDIYEALNRVNVILEQVPLVTDLEETEKNQILGEAYAMRALNLHNLTKFWGDVPMPLVSAKSVEEASQISRTPAAQVYQQIVADLAQAETLVTETGDATRVTTGFVDALQARVALYQGDWAGALAEADEVLAQGYTLAPDFTSLFDAEGTDTPEDILKLVFTAEQFSWHGFYYTSDDLGGEGTVGPSQKLIDVFDPADVRGTWSIFGDTEGEASGLKFPTTIGAEDFHVIRLAEVLLIKAEAQARLNDLVGAVDTYNPIRERAGLEPHTLGDEVTTQADVLAEIDLQRQLELAFEGDRWPDLVRSGRAVEVMGGIPEYQTLYPIPQTEIDVAPGVTQNPGY